MDDRQKTESVSSQIPPATRADFDVVDFEAPVRAYDVADIDGLYGLYETAFGAARDAGDEPAQRVYYLLGQVCGIRLHPSDTGNIWHPRWQLGSNARSNIADDFVGETSSLLAAIARKADNLTLKARCADIAWSNDRRDGASATIAVEVYCGIVNGLLDGGLKPSYNKPPTYDAVTPIHRALQLAHFTKSKNWPPCVTEAFDRLEAATCDGGHIGILVQLAELALHFHLRDSKTLAALLASTAQSAPADTYPMAVKSAWDLAARLYHGMKDAASCQNCFMGAVRQTLAMRKQVSGASAEAHWVMQALLQLRHIRGEETLKFELEADLRRLQKLSIDQMATFEIPMDVGDIPEKVAKSFRSMSLSEALRSFAMLTGSRDPEHLRLEALELAKATPLMASMPCTFVDGEGRTVVSTPGAPHDGEPDELWFTQMIERTECLRRHHAVRAGIHPARLVIQARYGLMPRHFEAIVGACPIIPEAQRPIMALGFARFFQGDLVSAAYLLVPQIEPLLRETLRINENDPSRRRDDSSEEDLSLATIYSRFSEQLEVALTPRLALEINRLFNIKPGPSVRHEIAHGKASEEDCCGPDVYYAVWLIYRLCCLFFLEQWEEIVTPQLAANACE